jgi:hypothetical protein
MLSIWFVWMDLLMVFLSIVCLPFDCVIVRPSALLIALVFLESLLIVSPLAHPPLAVIMLVTDGADRCLLGRNAKAGKLVISSHFAFSFVMCFLLF